MGSKKACLWHTTHDRMELKKPDDLSLLSLRDCCAFVQQIRTDYDQSQDYSISSQAQEIVSGHGF